MTEPRTVTVPIKFGLTATLILREPARPPKPPNPPQQDDDDPPPWLQDQLNTAADLLGGEPW